MNIHSELDTFQFINDEPNFEINLEQQFQIQDFTNKLNEESINEDKLSIYVKLCIIYLTEFEKFYIILNDVNIINNLEKLYEIIHVDIKISKFEIKTVDHIKYDFINFLNKNFLYKEYPTNSTSINEIQEIIINDINNINNFFVIQNKYSFSILLCDDENKKSSLIKKAIADDNKLNLKNDSYPPKIIIYNNEINDEVISEDSKYYSIKNEWIEQNKVEELEKIFKKIIYVLFNNSTNLCIIVDFSVSNIDIIKDFIIIKKYENLNEETYNNLIGMFNNKEFLDKDDLKKKVVSFEILYGFNIQTKEAHKEKIYIKNYINNNYTISNDVNKKMKASVILDYIIRDLNLQITDKLDFSKKISQYLLELNLNKKRFSDGIYYYGIEVKSKITDGQNLEELFNKNIEEREKEIKKINNLKNNSNNSISENNSDPKSLIMLYPGYWEAM